MSVINSAGYFFIAAASVAGCKTMLTPLYTALSHSLAQITAAILM